MKIHLRQIPEGETLHLEGEVDGSFLELEEVQCEVAGPLSYRLDIGLSEGGLFATGKLAVRVKATCVSCLEPFEHIIISDEFAMHRELDGREEVDLTPEIREDIQLLLPMHPRCHLGKNEKCPVQFSKIFSLSIEGSENRPFSSLLDNLTH